MKNKFIAFSLSSLFLLANASIGAAQPNSGGYGPTPPASSGGGGGGVSLTGGSTISPPDAGVGLTSSAINFAPPARLGGSVTTLGFGTGLDTPAFQVINTGPQNTFTITNTNANGIAAVSFRGVDRSYTNTSTVFEHGAIGWLPSFGSGANTGVTFWEGSRFDKALNALIPPPDMQIQQTGGIDPTGGTSQSCSITALSTAITCVGNLAANGSLITGNGTDIPPATTLVSGAGTTSGVISTAAGSTNASDTLNFSNPTYAVHTVIDSVPGGNLRIPSWDGSTNILNVDRINNRVGILTTSPGFPLDVNGDARVIGVLRFTNTSGIVSPSNVLHIGDLDNATPAANSIQFQSVAAGTSNTAGGNSRINGSLSTGTGSGGALFFQTSPAGSTGTTQNALVQRAAILSAGQVIIGNSSVIRAAENGAGFPIFEIQNNSASAINNGASISSYATSATQPANLYLAQSSNATLGTQTAVASNTLLGQLTNSGSDGTNFQNSSRITGAVDAAVSTGIVPGRIVFATANASGALTEALRINSSQQLVINGHIGLSCGPGVPTAGFTVTGGLVTTC